MLDIPYGTLFAAAGAFALSSGVLAILCGGFLYNSVILSRVALPGIAVSLKLKLDDEVAEIHWIPVGDMLKVYTCNDEIFELLKDVQNRILTRLSTS